MRTDRSDEGIWRVACMLHSRRLRRLANALNGLEQVIHARGELPRMQFRPHFSTYKGGGGEAS